MISLKISEQIFEPTGSYGFQFWLNNDGSEYHRLRGWAVKYHDDKGVVRRKEYRNNGELHREHGPASTVCRLSGTTKSYWIHGNFQRKTYNVKVL